MSSSFGGGALQPPGGQGAVGPNTGPGGGAISPQEGRPDPNQMALEMVRTITSAAGRLGMKYPAAMNEVRQINDLVSAIQRKIINSNPPAEPQAPPA